MLENDGRDPEEHRSIVRKGGYVYLEKASFYRNSCLRNGHRTDRSRPVKQH